MLKIVTVIGARPQIIKAAAVSRAIKRHFKHKIEEVIVHTGQHYDSKMSQVFIDELNIPQPNYNFGIGSATHGAQTGKMIRAIEEILIEENPDYIVLYGDTNSTLAGAIAASKIHVPIVHIEAGLRSHNKMMPEEINRILCDHSSTLLFTPTKTGFDNLVNEGFDMENKPPYSINNPGVFHCGDVMYDNTVYFEHFAKITSNILTELDLAETPFLLATVHRDNNTDRPERLNAIFSALQQIASEGKMRVVLPLHPRTAKALESGLEKKIRVAIDKNPFFKIIPSVSYLDIIMLEKHCEMVLTDSGGLQKEAYFLEKPCIILRSETEWKEIIEGGVGIVADADEKKIVEAYHYFSESKPTLAFPPIFGDGFAAEFICQKLIEFNRA